MQAAAWASLGLGGLVFARTLEWIRELFSVPCKGSL